MSVLTPSFVFRLQGEPGLPGIAGEKGAAGLKVGIENGLKQNHMGREYMYR